jgi:hypothetical protein
MSDQKKLEELESRIKSLEGSLSKLTKIGILVTAAVSISTAIITGMFSLRITNLQTESSKDLAASSDTLAKDVENLRADNARKLEELRKTLSDQQKSADSFEAQVELLRSATIERRVSALKELAASTPDCDKSKRALAVIGSLVEESRCNSLCENRARNEQSACYDACAELSRKFPEVSAKLCAKCADGRCDYN